MIRPTFLILFFSFLLAVTPAFSAKKDSYKIEIKVHGFSNEEVILGYYHSKQMRVADTILVDSDGFGTFQGNQLLPQGVYVIYSPKNGYFEILMGEDQHFRIESDTSDYIRYFKAINSLENSLLSEFQMFMYEKSEELGELNNLLSESGNAKEKEKYRNKIRGIKTERKEKILQISSENPNLFVSTLLLANLEVELPDIKALEDSGKDSSYIRQAIYKYQKDQYFKYFDVGDPRLLRTRLYRDKIITYLEKYIPQIPDTLIVEVDKIIDRSKADSTTFQFTLMNLFNHYLKSKIMGMDAVQIHIAKKYYLNEAWWSDSAYIADLKAKIEIREPLLLGKAAPNVQLRAIPSDHFIKAKEDATLKKYPHSGQFFHINDIQSEYTVLAFWYASCSHCKKAMPEFYKIYVDTLSKMNIKVVAISTLFGEDGKEKWVDFVNKHQMYDWINAWNPYDYQFKITYDIQTAPQFFVLNKEKEIIGKQIGPEDIAGLINAYERFHPN